MTGAGTTGAGTTGAGTTGAGTTGGPGDAGGEFATVATAELARLIRAERTMVTIRWGGVAFALVQTLTYYLPYPPGMLELALGLVVLLAAGNVALWRAIPSMTTVTRARRISVAALLLNGVVFVGLVFVYTFDTETAIWALLYVLPMEAAIRFQLRGALLTIGLLTAVYTAREVFGTLVYGNPFLVVSISFRMGVGLIIAAIAGALAQSLTRDREQLAALSGITRTVATAASLQDVLDGATVRLTALFRVPSAGIALLDADGLLTVRAAHGGAPGESGAGGPIAATGDGAAARALSARRAVAVSGTETTGGPGGALLAPLLARDEVIGLVTVESADRRRVFSAADLALAEAVAGQLAGAIATARLHEQAQRARAAADAANAAKSTFLATMSHEIRTPMNAVIGMTELLAGTGLTTEQRELVTVIEQSGDGLLAIIDDVLDFSKIEAGRLELERVPLDVRDTVEGVLDLLAPRAAAKGLELAGAVDPDVPDAVFGDPTRLRQILVNLVGNAVKFTERGEVVVTVHGAWTSERADELRIEVSDTGPGIPPDRLDRLFRSFSQVDSSTTRLHGGTGLGLAISRRLAELMGGRIGVRSAVDPGTGGPGATGTTFTVTIPAEPAPPARATPAAPDALAGRRVLVVDDNATNRQIVRAHCTGWGMSVRETASPDEAIAWVAAGVEFDLAVLDHNMPGTDGSTLARRLRASGGPPVLCLSSLGEVRDRDAVDAWLTKPVKRAALAAALAELTGAPRLSPAEMRRPDGPVADRPLRLLLAEDNPVNRTLAVALLGRLGHTADVVVDGMAVLDALDRRRYDAVLLDVQMPVLDGLETARRIRTRPADGQPWLIAVTANAMVGDRERCLAAGMDDYLAKPIRLAGLAAALDRCPRQDPEAGARAVLDPAVLAALAQSLGPGGEDVVAEVVEAAVAEIPRLVQRLQADPAARGIVAHTLKSTAATLGAGDLAADCRALEADPDGAGLVARVVAGALAVVDELTHPLLAGR